MIDRSIRLSRNLSQTCDPGPANMTSLNGYSSKLVLLGFLLVVRSLPTVWSAPPRTLNYNSSKLEMGQKLVSDSGHFELGIFQYPAASNDDSLFYLCIRYTRGFDGVVTWVANRDTPVFKTSTLQLLGNGTLQLYDSRQPSNSVPWSTTNTAKVVEAKLNDTGNLLLLDATGSVIWDSFKDSPPTDTLLPGQYLIWATNQNGLISWQKNGSPATVNGTYSFGWTNNILTLSWRTPQIVVNWAGGAYIPARDVYDVHKISNVSYVYFHATLGHLYINSEPADTAILSGGPDPVDAKTLKRITVDTDGGFRIWQWTIGHSTSWTVEANWVVSERPDIRSQCATFGTCGPYGWCVSAIDSLERVECRCPPGFKMNSDQDPAQGCYPSTFLDCNNNDVNITMIQLDGVDMPWGGDLRNITDISNATECKDACANDCNCSSAVFSMMEKVCWVKSGTVYNMGYPTVPLHGNDRTAFIKILKGSDYVPPKSNKRVIIVVPIVVGGIAIGILALVFCFCRREDVRGCGLCRRLRCCCTRQDGATDVGDYSGSDSEPPARASQPPRGRLRSASRDVELKGGRANEN